MKNHFEPCQVETISCTLSPFILSIHQEYVTPIPSPMQFHPVSQDPLDSIIGLAESCHIQHLRPMMSQPKKSRLLEASHSVR